MKRHKSKRLVSITFSFIVAFCAVVAGNAAAQTDSTDKFEIVRAYVQTWLDGAKADRLLISSSNVKVGIIDDWNTQIDKIQIVSLRQPDDYNEAGHVPHAMNIYWGEILNDSSLARLDPAKTLILYCYFGHASMLTCTILNLLGYTCRSMSFGIMDWNLDAVVKAPWDREADYEIDTVIEGPEEIYPLPLLATGMTNARDIIKSAALEYLGGSGSPIIPSSGVMAIVENWDSTQAEYHIVDARSPAAYQAGHISYAINIPWQQIAEPAHLQMLDPGRTVIVYTENGQTGQIAATLLNLLGYRAIAIKFGLMDWNRAAVDALMQWDGEAAYPVEKSK